MRGSIRGGGSSRGPAAVFAAVLGAVLAALLAGLLGTGCSSAANGGDQATAQTCVAFGVRALEQHLTVTTVPRACAGLSNAAVNLAVSRALHEVVGPRPKAAARRLADRDSARLARLIRTVPAPRPVRQVTSASRPVSDVPLSLAALAAWLVTATAGTYLLSGWLRDGGLRRASVRTGAGGRAGGIPPVVIGHFVVAVTGLGLWIAFLVTDLRSLAWIAAGLLLPAAGLGMATLVTALPEPSRAQPGRAASAGAGTSGAGTSGAALATRIAATAGPARTRMPVVVIAAHGVLATVTMLLVLLAAIGAS